MSDINVHLIDFPEGAKGNEAVTPNEDGSYSVFINARAASNKQQEAYLHALEHIKNDDFSSSESVQAIEAKAHGIKAEKPAQVKIRRKKKLTRWEKYHRKQERTDKALARMGLMRESYIGDDEYGCPVVKYRIVKRRW